MTNRSHKNKNHFLYLLLHIISLMLAQLEQGVIGWSNSSTALGMLRQLVAIID